MPNITEMLITVSDLGTARTVQRACDVYTLRSRHSFGKCLFRKDFFYLGFTAHQDYFTHFEPSQSVDWANTGDPREKTPNHRQQNLACFTCDLS